MLFLSNEIRGIMLVEVGWESLGALPFSLDVEVNHHVVRVGVEEVPMEVPCRGEVEELEVVLVPIFSTRSRGAMLVEVGWGF